MAEDIRIETSWKTHPKRIKLQRKLGHEGLTAWLDLLLTVSECRPRGVLDGWKEEEIEIAAQWAGQPGIFVAACLQIGLIEQNGSQVFLIHDWEDHNPWVFHAPERSEQAKSAARVRWQRAKDKASCSQHKSAKRAAQKSNAPYPSPNPSPSPNPNTKEDTIVPRRNDVSLETAYECLIFPVKGGEEKTWELPDDLYDEWQKLYNGMNILHELQKALAYVRANPGRQKTIRGMPRFLLSWLARAQNSGSMRTGRQR
jgi:hypothetical protein